jgi:hypothetical protein
MAVTIITTATATTVIITITATTRVILLRNKKCFILELM